MQCVGGGGMGARAGRAMEKGPGGGGLSVWCPCHVCGRLCNAGASDHPFVGQDASQADT
jgi:hypothetical protein